MNKVMIAQFDGLASAEFIVLPKTPEIDANYLLKILTSADFVEFAIQKSKGDRPRVDFESIGDYEFSLPSPDEQQNLVTELNARIVKTQSALTEIEKARALIEKYKNSFIELAYTRSRTAFVDEPKVKLRSWKSRGTRANVSGGRDEVPIDFPEHWQYVHVGEIAELQAGYAFKSEWFGAEGYKLLRGTNIVPGGTRWDETVFLSFVRSKDYEQYSLQAGDILIAMDRPIISSGIKVTKLSDADLPALLVQRVGRFKLVDGIVQDYLYWFLQSRHFIDHITDKATGTQLPHISQNDIESAKIPLPSTCEQLEICEYLRKSMSAVEILDVETSKSAKRIKFLESSLVQRYFSEPD